MGRNMFSLIVLVVGLFSVISGERGSSTNSRSCTTNKCSSDLYFAQQCCTQGYRSCCNLNNNNGGGKPGQCPYQGRKKRDIEGKSNYSGSRYNNGGGGYNNGNNGGYGYNNGNNGGGGYNNGNNGGGSYNNGNYGGGGYNNGNNGGGGYNGGNNAGTCRSDRDCSGNLKCCYYNTRFHCTSPRI